MIDSLELFKLALLDATGHTLYEALPAGNAGVAGDTIRVQPGNDERRHRGLDWPVNGLTMIGHTGLDNLEMCVETVLRDRIPGDFIECGVWRGGASIFMRAMLHLWGDHSKHVWVADSFEGLPPPSHDRDYMDFSPQQFLAVPLERVKANFARFRLLDHQVDFLKGWFRDTLPTVRDQSWSIIRLDGDLYESTMDGLINLYPQLSPGGFLIVDDYVAMPPAQEAVHDYRALHDITEQIIDVDGQRAFWRKGA